MTEKISETTFENAIVGDRVYSPMFKCVTEGDKTNAKIIKVWTNNEVDIMPDIPSEYINIARFNMDGSYVSRGGQVLFWENPISEIPIRPKRKVVKKGWIGILPAYGGNCSEYIANTTCIYSTKEKTALSGTEGIIYQEIEFEVEE